jgi:hypothetical protein
MPVEIQRRRDLFEKEEKLEAHFLSSFFRNPFHNQYTYFHLFKLIF